jgi:hypothetical protein
MAMLSIRPEVMVLPLLVTMVKYQALVLADLGSAKAAQRLSAYRQDSKHYCDQPPHQ